MPMHRTIVEELGQLSLFRGLSGAVVARVARHVTERRFATDEVLCRKGEIGDALYVIRSGRVKVTTVDAQGDELSLNQCGPGEVIGEVSLIDSSPHTATVIAMEPVDTLVLGREALLDEVRAHPEVALEMTRLVSRRLRFA